MSSSMHARTGAGPPVRRTLPAKRLFQPMGASSFWGDADAADDPAGVLDDAEELVPDPEGAVLGGA
jgi:hypothetical protein